jgi:hypothetical protein
MPESIDGAVFALRETTFNDSEKQGPRKERKWEGTSMERSDPFLRQPAATLLSGKEHEMNIAIGNKTFGRNPRFALGILFAGLTATAIVTGVAVWPTTDSGAPPTVAESPAAPAVRPIEPAAREVTPVHYYLVNSQGQIDGLLEAEFEASVNNSGAQADFITHVIDLRTPAGEALYRALQEDLNVASTQYDFDASLVQIHDLTAPANGIPSAGSFSSETSSPTIYIVGSEAERQQLLNEADVAAAVEGGDSELPRVVVVDASDPEALQLEEVITEDRLNGGIGANAIDLR